MTSRVRRHVKTPQISELSRDMHRMSRYIIRDTWKCHVVSYVIRDIFTWHITWHVTKRHVRFYERDSRHVHVTLDFQNLTRVTCHVTLDFTNVVHVTFTFTCHEPPPEDFELSWEALQCFADPISFPSAFSMQLTQRAYSQFAFRRFVVSQPHLVLIWCGFRALYIHIKCVKTWVKFLHNIENE